MDLEAFRGRVQACRRPTGRAQKELARALGLHPTVLSHKLHGSNDTALTHPEVKAIVKTLAAWQAITSRAEAVELLELAGLTERSFTATDWQAPPLSLLAPGSGRVSPRPSPTRGTTPAPALAPASPLAVPRHALPAPATPLVGRAREVAAARDLLAGDARLLTFTGVGGTGKTRLALQVAAELLAADAFADGVAFVPLAGTADPALVPAAIAQRLGLTERAGVPLSDLLAGWLRDRRLLLVLDNVEHLLPAAPLIGELLAAAPGLKVLATSRVALRLYGEHECRVPPLTFPNPAAGGPAITPEEVAASEAGQLFVARARAARPGFAVTAETAPLVAEVCARLDGLPLALELAAARLRLFSLPQLLARLESRLLVLTGGPRNLPERQQTLRDLLDWSYQLLTPEERRRFARLAAFAGGITADAAAALGAEDAAGHVTLEGLAALADQGLLEYGETAEGEEGPRFRMLETVREYALARLAESGEAAVVRRRHAQYYLALAEAAARALRGPAQRRWLTRLATERDNLRAALGWALAAGETAVALRLGAALWPAWERRGQLSEGRRWLDAALALASAHEPAWPWAAIGAARLAHLQGDAARADALLADVLTQPHWRDDHQIIAAARFAQGWVAHHRGDFGRAAARYAESLARQRQAGDRWGSATTLLNLGGLAMFQGDFPGARAHFMESLALFRALGDEWSMVVVLGNLGGLALLQGEYAESARLSAEALARYREFGDQVGLALALVAIGVAVGAQGVGPAPDPARLQLVARLFGGAEAVREAIALTLPPAFRQQYEHWLAAIRAGADEVTWAAAWAEGRTAAPEDVIREALLSAVPR